MPSAAKAWALGQTVEVHQPFDDATFTVRWAGQTIATHRQAASGNDDVWDPGHYATSAAIPPTPRHWPNAQFLRRDEDLASASSNHSRRAALQIRPCERNRLVD